MLAKFGSIALLFISIQDQNYSKMICHALPIHKLECDESATWKNKL